MNTLRKRQRDGRVVPLREFFRAGTARATWQWLHGADGRAWLRDCAAAVQEQERERFPRLRQYAQQPWAQWRDGRAVFVVNQTFVAYFRARHSRQDCITRQRTDWREDVLEIRWLVPGGYKQHVIIVEL